MLLVLAELSCYSLFTGSSSPHEHKEQEGYFHQVVITLLIIIIGELGI